MKNKSMIQIVAELQAEGHTIDFYVRTDGGILIRSIDGVRYPSGASGNARARQMVGASISEARIAQLKYATRAHKAKKPQLDDEIEKEYRRVKRLWNKRFKAQGGKPHPAGYFGKSRIRETIKIYGKKEALRRIHEAERYASGLAYSKNVEHLASYILESAEKLNSDELRKLSEDVSENAYMIREEWIIPAYQKLYEINHGLPIEQVVSDVRKILRLDVI